MVQHHRPHTHWLYFTVYVRTLTPVLSHMFTHTPVSHKYIHTRKHQFFVLSWLLDWLNSSLETFVFSPLLWVSTWIYRNRRIDLMRNYKHFYIGLIILEVVSFSALSAIHCCFLSFLKLLQKSLYFQILHYTLYILHYILQVLHFTLDLGQSKHS